MFRLILTANIAWEYLFHLVCHNNIVLSIKVIIFGVGDNAESIVHNNSIGGHYDIGFLLKHWRCKLYEHR